MTAVTMGTVCAVGTECSGKTTLCERLAKRFQVPWLPEYAREHLDGAPYGESDVADIAREHMRREAALLARHPGGVVLDTDLAVIWVWWHVKFGRPPAWLEQAFAAQTPRLYLLCRPDLPWRPDPLRESAGERWRLHERYRRLLQARRLPFVEIGGRGTARTEAAAAHASRAFEFAERTRRGGR